MIRPGCAHLALVEWAFLVNVVARCQVDGI